MSWESYISFLIVLESLSSPQSVARLVCVITVTLRLWSLAAENVLWQLVRSNIWPCVCRGLLVDWRWSINTFPLSHNPVYLQHYVCLCVWKGLSVGISAVCFPELHGVCLRIIGALGAGLGPLSAWCWFDIVEIRATVNKADRGKIAPCVPTTSSSALSQPCVNSSLSQSSDCRY